MENFFQDLDRIKDLMNCSFDGLDYNMLYDEYCKNELNFINILFKKLPDDLHICHPFIENINNLSINVKKQILYRLIKENHADIILKPLDYNSDKFYQTQITTLEELMEYATFYNNNSIYNKGLLLKKLNQHFGEELVSEIIELIPTK